MNIKLVFEQEKDCACIFIDESPWKKIHSSIFGKRNLFPSSCESMEEWNSLFKEIEYKRAKGFVLRRLSLKSYYSKQIEKQLSERFISRANISRIIEEFSSLGYLNDEDWLNAFIRSHIKRYGLKMISLKLKAKGVSPEDSQTLTKQWKDSEQEISTISELLRTKYKNKDLQDYKTKQKIIGALIRKGYSFELIQKALNQMNIEAEEFEFN